AAAAGRLPWHRGARCARAQDGGRPDEARKAPVQLFRALPLRAVLCAGCGPRAARGRGRGMTPEEAEAFKKSRRGRSIALALVLAAFVVLFYAITIVKMN